MRTLPLQLFSRARWQSANLSLKQIIFIEVAKAIRTSIESLVQVRLKANLVGKRLMLTGEELDDDMQQLFAAQRKALSEKNSSTTTQTTESSRSARKRLMVAKQQSPTPISLLR